MSFVDDRYTSGEVEVASVEIYVRRLGTQAQGSSKVIERPLEVHRDSFGDSPLDVGRLIADVQFNGSVVVE